jgi:pyruvate/2-oxoglutarate dehydrogenase complex dihydrolipoamide acyltransferase (E2) component
MSTISFSRMLRRSLLLLVLGLLPVFALAADPAPPTPLPPPPPAPQTLTDLPPDLLAALSALEQASQRLAAAEAALQANDAAQTQADAENAAAIQKLTAAQGRADAEFAASRKRLEEARGVARKTYGAAIGVYHQIRAKHYPPLDPAPNPQPQPPAPPSPPAPPKEEVKTLPPGGMLFFAAVPSILGQSDVQAAIETSKPLADLLASKLQYKRWTDPLSCPASLKVWLDRAQADGLPRVLIVDWTAKQVVDSVPMTDEAAAIALVKKWQGR